MFVLAVGQIVTLPIEPTISAPTITPPKTPSYNSNTTATAVRLTRRQLDIDGGSVVYDDSDSSIVEAKHDVAITGDPADAVVVYEIVPRFIDGWPSSSANLLNTESLLVEEPYAQVASAEQDQMDVAETHLFRPLFRYRAVQEEKNKQRHNDDN